MSDPVICAAIVARGIMGLIRSAVSNSTLMHVSNSAIRANVKLPPTCDTDSAAVAVNFCRWTNMMAAFYRPNVSLPTHMGGKSAPEKLHNNGDAYGAKRVRFLFSNASLRIRFEKWLKRDDNVALIGG